MKAIVAALALLVADHAGAADWRRLATPDDRGRLRGWRDAWVSALAQARMVPAGAAAIAADPGLYDPDRALIDPIPPAGDYRCRTIKLGNKGKPGSEGAVGLSYIAYDRFRCRVGPGPGPVSLFKISGSQRPVGVIYADTDARAIFLGSLALGDEVKPVPYGRDRSRDMAGIVERIGERRWRLLLPYPAYESTLDVIDLVPADR